MIPAPRHNKADPAADEARQIEHVREDLIREFAGVPARVVETHVRKQVQHFKTAPVRSFVPVLVRRGARGELRHLV